MRENDVMKALEINFYIMNTWCELTKVMGIKKLC